MPSKVVPTLQPDIVSAVHDDADIPEQERVFPRPMRLQRLNGVNEGRSLPQSPLESWTIEEPSRRSYDKAAVTDNIEGVLTVSSGSTPAVTRRTADALSARQLDDDQRGSDATVQWDLAGGGGKRERTPSGNGSGGHRREGSAAEPPRLVSSGLVGAPVLGSPETGEAGAAPSPAKRGEYICPAAGVSQAGKPATLELRTAWTKLGTGEAGRAGDDAKGGQGAGEDGEGRGSKGPDTPKTVPKLRGLVRKHVASYAEENFQDVWAEINSLSKISVEDEAEEAPRFLLQHESSGKLAWDIFMVLLIIFSAFMDPLQIGFDVYPTGALWAIDVLVDFAFMTDVGINFRTTALDADTKETITDTKEIAASYLKGWFVVDLLSSLPLALVARSIDLTEVEKYFLVLKLVRTLKLRQLSVITSAVLERFEDRDFNPVMFRIYMLVLAFVLVVHFIACGYWFVSRANDPEFEGMWSPEHEYLDAGLYLQYSRALYFSLVITYGNDLRPDTHWEYIFSNVCLALALLANAVIIGSATNLMSNLDAGAVAKKQQIDEINTYMHFRKIPKDIQKRIRTFYEYMWASGQDSHSSSLFEEMPDKLKLQLNIALKKRLIDKVPLFKTFTPAGTISLVQKLIPSIILPGELIVRQGELATSMFFISRGTVRVLVISDPDDSGNTPPEETYIISLGAGSFFGEVALLEEDHVRTASVRAETFTELQALHSQDFKTLAEVFPEFQTAVNMISKSRVKAGEALSKMKARNKKFGERFSRKGPASTSLKMMRAALDKANAQREGSKEPKNWIPKMRLVADRLVEANRTSKEKIHKATTSAARMLANSGQSFSSPRPPGSPHRGSRTVYETIVAHEALVSHEAAISMARGASIARQDLTNFL